MRHWVAAVLVGGSLLFCAHFASAMRVTWHLSGVISTADPDLNSLGVDQNTPFTANITYESSTPASSPGTFPDAVISVSFQAAAYSFAFWPTSSRADLFGSNFTISAVGLTPVGLYSPAVQLQLIDAHFPAPPVPGLPVVPPSSVREFDIYTGSGGPGPTAYAYGFAITYSVPEPASLAPLALFVAALIRRRAVNSVAIR